MNPLVLRIAEIERNAAPHEERILGLFRYETDGQRRQGSLLLCAEIFSSLYVYEQLLETINETIERQRTLLSGFDGDPIARFEKLLSAINQAVSDFVATDPHGIAWNRVNLFLFDIQGEHLSISGVGMLSNIFLQQQSDGTHRAFDLLGSVEQPPEPVPTKLFSGLISGEFKEGDVFFVGSHNFDRLRQELAIKELLTSHPPVAAAFELERRLELANIPDDFSAVVLSQTTDTPMHAASTIVEDDAPAKPQSTASIERMYEEEKATNAALNVGSTALPSDLKETIKETIASITSRFQKRADTGVPRSAVAMAGLRTMHAGHGESFTKKQKLSLLAVSVGVIALIGGIFGYRYYQTSKEREMIWSSNQQAVLQLVQQGKDSLIYNNEDQATRLLREAQTRLRDVAQDTDAHKAGYAAAEKELESLRATLRKETVLDAPHVAFQTAGALTQLAVSGGNLLTFDTVAKNLLLLGADGSSTAVAWPESEPPRAITQATNAFILFGSEQAYRLPSKGGALVGLPISGEVPLVDAATTYGQRVYTLDRTNGMIWRHTLSTSSVGSRDGYIKQTTNDIHGATSFAIDSSVYVGFENGTVARYLSGVQESWSLASVDPAPTRIQTIWTQSESDRLVLLADDRVIVFSKDGKLIKQFRSPQFTHTSALTVDTEKRTIYLISENNVYSIDLP